MKLLNNKGTTFVEIILATVVILFMFQMTFQLLLLQKNFYKDNYFSAEQKRQLYFAETYLKRDFFESAFARSSGENRLELTDYSGTVVTYYLAQDPYGEESWKGQSTKTLYRKISGENAQPITQYCTSFFVKEIDSANYTKVGAELVAENKNIVVEELYEKD